MSAYVGVLISVELVGLFGAIVFGIAHSIVTPKWIWARAGLEKERWVAFQILALLFGLGGVGCLAYFIRAKPRLKSARASHEAAREEVFGGSPPPSDLPTHPRPPRPDEPSLVGLDVAKIRKALGRE